MLGNKLGITNEIELKKEEERLTKLKALELFDTNKINELEVGTLPVYPKYMKIYYFAGKLRKDNISKGNVRFASSMYLKEVLYKIVNSVCTYR